MNGHQCAGLVSTTCIARSHWLCWGDWEWAYYMRVIMRTCIHVRVRVDVEQSSIQSSLQYAGKKAELSCHTGSIVDMFMYNVYYIYSYDGCVGVQRRYHGLHVSCSTVKT